MNKEINTEQERFIAEQVIKALNDLQEFSMLYFNEYGENIILRSAIARLQLLKNVNYEYILSKYTDE